MTAVEADRDHTGPIVQLRHGESEVEALERARAAGREIGQPIFVYRDDGMQPTFRPFVADYEAARGRPFEREKRHLLSGVFAYTVAYLARGGHALGRKREAPGTFTHLVWTEGVRLLDL